MTSAEKSAELEVGSDIDLIDSSLEPSPLEASPFGSISSCLTPDTEISGLSSPQTRQLTVAKARVWARTKLVELTQEEKVSFAPLSFQNAQNNRLTVPGISANSSRFLENASYSFQRHTGSQDKRWAQWRSRRHICWWDKGMISGI